MSSKVSALAAATIATDADYVYVIQGGVSKKMTRADLLSSAEHDWEKPQYATAHDYGTVTATKTVSLADGNNLKLTTTSATNLTLTASDFQVDQHGVITIIKGGTETVSFDATFSGLNAQDLSAASTFEIPYKSQSATVTLGTAIEV